MAVRGEGGRFQRAPQRTYPAPFKGVHIDGKQIASGITQAVERAMNQTLQEMYEVAHAKVPVRKVFKGGRRKLRFATPEEAAEATKTLNRMQANLPLAERVQPNFIPAPPGFKGKPSSKEGKQFYRVVDDTSPLTRTYRTRSGESRTRLNAARRTGRDRANDKYDDTREYANPFSSEPGYLTEGNDERLNTRGRFDTRTRRGQSADKIGGSLKKSIHVDPVRITTAGNRIRLVGKLVAGGERAPYARFVELGTAKAPAQPFLRPALHGAETVLRGRIEAEIKRSVAYTPSKLADAAQQQQDQMAAQFFAMLRGQ